jgi:hypothetical protein
MKYFLNHFLVSLLALVLLSSCEKECPDPESETGDSAIGGYSGSFTYRKSNETEDSTETRSAIVSRNDDYSDKLEVAIELFDYIVILEEMEVGNSGDITGSAKLYTDRYKIGEEGQEIAGSGSFVYDESGIMIIWTASDINGRWSVKYESSE